MGVKDLWQLLSPIGRRVSVESLEGKILAIDASIWITQFIKAMRDEEGKMMKNAHLIGTLRRVLRLLFHKIRPLFVFDGATPELKLRVVQARRKGRELQVWVAVAKQAMNICKYVDVIFLRRRVSGLQLNGCCGPIYGSALLSSLVAGAALPMVRSFQALR
jgi:DNA excision repair protein ERCC-5